MSQLLNQNYRESLFHSGLFSNSTSSGLLGEILQTKQEGHAELLQSLQKCPCSLFDNHFLICLGYEQLTKKAKSNPRDFVAELHQMADIRLFFEI